MKIKDHKIVHIVWEDAAGGSGWHPYTDEDVPSIVETVSILMGQNKQGVTVSDSLTSNGNFREALTIPRSAIRKLKYI